MTSVPPITHVYALRIHDLKKERGRKTVDIRGDMGGSCQERCEYCQNEELDEKCNQKVSGSRQGSIEKFHGGQTELCQQFG